MQQELTLKIDNVSKKYKLGQIGGTTLRDELQRKRAKRKGLEDPTTEIGARKVNVGEEFYALSNVSFEVKKGERVGIIGHNGAGKSTLLKLISRVTAPTEGTISMNGRVASMLEVGTGFHGELTGRENIYMNGAILGMTKKEIDSKIEDIIEFSECRDFIDTPVKRYSSGMYVKLAFSVAAHLDSEIMIMDEVLAVGDMAFQKKCLDKMNDVSREDGRTILYVSHNMNTIRQLCDRVIVLDHGQVIFDGDVEEGISIYLGVNIDELSVDIDLSKRRMPHFVNRKKTKMKHMWLLEKDEAVYKRNENIKVKLEIDSKISISNICIRFEVRTINDIPVGTAILNYFDSIFKYESKTYIFNINLNGLVSGKYKTCLVLYTKDEFGNYIDLDAAYPACIFVVNDSIYNKSNMLWQPLNWGNIEFPTIELVQG